jgi:hypothetical protein
MIIAEEEDVDAARFLPPTTADLERFVIPRLHI